MGLFGGKNEQRQQYQVVETETDAIPVATLVTDEDVENPPVFVAPPPPTAPLRDQPPPTTTTTTSSSSSTTTFWTRHPTSIPGPCCPHCHAVGARTRIETFPTCHSWLFAAVLLLVFWPICWIPLVMDACKQTNHHCVNCNAKVGQVDAFADCCVKRRG